MIKPELLYFWVCPKCGSINALKAICACGNEHCPPSNIVPIFSRSLAKNTIIATKMSMNPSYASALYALFERKEVTNHGNVNGL